MMESKKSIQAHQTSKKARGLRHNWHLLMIPIAISFALLLWESASRWSGLPAFILPSPVAVFNRTVRAIQDGTLIRHTLATLLEVLGGLFLGTTSAIILGYGYRCFTIHSYRCYCTTSCHLVWSRPALKDHDQRINRLLPNLDKYHRGDSISP
jgi:hypothetical protein